MSKQDYYEILGVSKDASADDIKRAYRKLAIKYHPDKEGGDEQKFKEATEAYETLKDPAKRQQYDQFGHAAYQSAQGSGGYGPFQGHGGQQFEFDLGDLDLGDIFGSFFGGGQRSRQTAAQKGRDVETRMTLNFEEAVFGVEKTITLNLDDFCSRCEGKMAEPGSDVKTCKTCGGKGQVVHTQRTVLGAIQHAGVCPDCSGSGSIPEKICSECGGKGTKRKKQSLNVKIPAGIQDGSTIRLRQRGEAPKKAGPKGVKGDLYVHVAISKSPHFKRIGHDIVSEEKIDMIDAALGTEIKIKTVDGDKKIKIPAGTQNGQTFRISGSGVPFNSSDRRGDHLVKVEVAIPKRLSAKQKNLLEQLRDNRKKKWF